MRNLEGWVDRVEGLAMLDYGWSGKMEILVMVEKERTRKQRVVDKIM